MSEPIKPKPIKKAIKEMEATSDKKGAEILKSVATEFVNVQEAFELGRSLQRILEAEQECSNTFLTENEIIKVIEFVKENLRQARY